MKCDKCNGDGAATISLSCHREYVQNERIKETRSYNIMNDLCLKCVHEIKEFMDKEMSSGS